MFKDEMARKARLAQEAELTLETINNRIATRNTPSCVTHVSDRILKFYLKRKPRELSSSTVSVFALYQRVSLHFEYFDNFRREYVRTEGGWRCDLYDKKLFCAELTKILRENGLIVSPDGDRPDSILYVSYKI